MHDIHLVLRKLNDYFDVKRISAEELESSLCRERKDIDYGILINQLTEICTECRQTRESDVFDNTHDSWEYFQKIISVKHLLAFFAGLCDLTLKNDEANAMHIRVSLTICRTYVLLLTSPGAKIFDAFEPELLRKVFKMFEIVKRIGKWREHDRVQAQMLLIMLLEDFHLYLKHVSFEEYEDLQLQFIEAIAAIMEFHHQNGLQNKCKETRRLIFSAICSLLANTRNIVSFQTHFKFRNFATAHWKTVVFRFTVRTYRRVYRWF